MEIESLGGSLGRVRKALQARERGPKVAQRVPVGGPRYRPEPSPAMEFHGLVPSFGPKRVMGEAIHVLVEAPGRTRFDSLHETEIERAALRPEDHPVRYLVSQRMREGVLEIGEQSCLVEELRRLETRQALLQRV